MRKEEIEEKYTVLIDKEIPDKITALTVIRDTINTWAMGLCNLSRQEKHDINRCLNYLIKDATKQEPDVVIGSHLQHSINKGELISYGRDYEENGYDISISIRRKD